MSDTAVRTNIGQTWDTAAYAASGRFVANLATSVVALLAPQPGEHLLDVGCGDGALTEQLAATGAIVSGVDASAAMVAAARARGLKVDHYPAESLPYRSQFDAVFSNAALHWLPAEKQSIALAAIQRALKPGGRFVAEMGGQGNIAAIRTALRATLAPYSIDAEAAAASFFPSPTAYTRLLEAAGFKVHSIDLIPRPTPIYPGPDGRDAMTTWLSTFRNGVLDLVLPAEKPRVIAATVALLEPILRDRDGNWTADYVPSPVPCHTSVRKTQIMRGDRRHTARRTERLAAVSSCETKSKDMGLLAAAISLPSNQSLKIPSQDIDR